MNELALRMGQGLIDPVMMTEEDGGAEQTGADGEAAVKSDGGLTWFDCIVVTWAMAMA